MFASKTNGARRIAANIAKLPDHLPKKGFAILFFGPLPFRPFPKLMNAVAPKIGNLFTGFSRAIPEA
jgi:hypothetical protein